MPSPNDIKAGGAYVELYLRDKAALAGLNGFAKRFQATARKIQSAGRQMAITALVAATPFIAATKIYADYTKQLAFVSTMLDAPREHMERFSKGMRKLSVEFGQTTDALSKGMFDILSAQFAPSEAMGLLRTATESATAGFTTTAVATKALIKILTSYGLAAGDAESVSDSLFTAVEQGILTYEQLAQNIGNVSSMAASSGVSIDEMLASIDAMTRGGVEAETAIVALQNILKVFLSKSGEVEEFAAKLENLGVVGKINLEGIKERGFISLLKEIAALPADVIAKLFPNLRGQRGILPIKQQLLAIDGIMNAFADKDGSKNRALEKVIGTLGILIDRVKQAGILMLSQIGEALSRDLKEVGKEVLFIAKGFGVWVKNNKQALVSLAKMIVLLAKVGIALLLVGKALAIVATITAIMSGPKGWIGLAAGIMVGLAAFYALDRSVKGITRSLKELGDTGRAAVDDTVSGVSKVGSTDSIKNRAFLNSFLGSRSSTFGDSERDQVGALGVLQGDILQSEFQERNARNRAARVRNKPHGLRGDDETDWDEAARWAKENKQKAQSLRNIQAEINSILIIRSSKEKELKLLELHTRLAKRNADIEKSRAGIMESQLSTMKAMKSVSSKGFFSGFYNAPVLTFSSTSKKSPEVDILSQIDLKLGERGPIAEAIKDNKIKTK